MVTPCFLAHFISFSLMYSGPLSTLMVPGLPRHSMILSRLRMSRFSRLRGLIRRFNCQLAVDPPDGDCGAIPDGQWIDAFVPSHACKHALPGNRSTGAPSRCAGAENTGQIPGFAGIGQTGQKIGNFFVLGAQLGAIAITGLADTKGTAGQGDAGPASRHCILGHLSALTHGSGF